MTTTPDLKLIAGECGDTRKPKFGEWMRGIYASEENPTRDGMYVRTVRRTGRMNPGKFYELTDGNGKFWMYWSKDTVFLLRAADESATDYAAANAAEKEPRTITQETIHAMREAAGYRPWRLSDDEVAAMARVAIAGVVSDEPTQHMIEEGVKSLRCDLDLTRRPQTRTAQRAARNLYVTMRAASLAPTQEGGGNGNPR